MAFQMLAVSFGRAHAGARFAALGAVLVLAMCGWPAKAQEPSSGTIAAAKELIELKGATNMFDPVVPGVIETAKNMFLQTNLGLSKDLNEIAAQLKKDYAGKRGDISNEMARTYA